MVHLSETPGSSKTFSQTCDSVQQETFIDAISPLCQLHHYGDVDKETRSVVGNTQDEFVKHMTETFPGLVLFVWLAAAERRKEEKLKSYFTSDFKLRSVHIAVLQYL